VIVAHIIQRLIRGVVLGILHRWFVTLLALIMICGGMYAAAAQGMIPGVTLPSSIAPAAASVGPSDVREMAVEEIRPNRAGDQITLILKEKGGNRRLVMAVGQSEALAIYSDMNRQARLQVEPPTSYDLMRSLVQELGGTVNRVVVNNVTNETFYAKVIMSTESRQVEVDSRPSDAIALALRAHVPIFAEASVLDRAGVVGGG
jgi:uncharacterized protein